MKLRVALIAGAALCAAAISPVYAAEGWYVGLGAGWEKPNDFTFQTVNGPGIAYPNGGFIATGAVGYKYGNWRLEMEGSGSHTKYLGSQGGVIWTGGSLNLLYDFHIMPRVGMYVGGGVGGGDLNREAYLPGIGVAQYGQWGLQWQAIAGVQYTAFYNLDLYAEYRYRGLELEQPDGNLSGRRFRRVGQRHAAERCASRHSLLSVRRDVCAAAAATSATPAATSATAAPAGEDVHRLLRLQQGEPDG